MSIKKPQFIFLIFMLLSFGLYKFAQPKTMTRRSFAGQVNVSQFSSHGVVDRLIDLKIKTGDLKSEHANESTNIVAHFSVPFDLSEPLHYKWTLGQNVTLTDGVLEGQLTSPPVKDQVEKIAISVKGFSADQLRHIGFEIWGERNGRRIYADGLISSQKENSFEAIVQHVEKMKNQKTGVSK